MATLRELLRNYEKIVIIKTMGANRFNIVATSRALGITRQALYRRLEKLGVDMETLRRQMKDL